MDLDLFHHSEPQALRGATLELALHGERVDRLADVLRRRELDDFDQPELGVHVDHRAVRGERELHVRVGLAGLGIEAIGYARMKLARLVDDGVAKEGGERDDLLAVGADNDVVLDAQLTGGVQLRPRQVEDPLAHHF